MENKENCINIQVDHAFELIAAKVKLDKKRKQDNERQQKAREKAKQKGKKSKIVLRTNPRQIFYNIIISNKLEEIKDYNIADRMLQCKKMFRTIIPYGSNVGEGPYIIQFQYNNCWLDWLEVKKSSSDPEGYGLFALQDIEPMKRVTLYLGEQYDNEDSKNSATFNDTYVFQTHVKHDMTKNKWVRNKKRSVYVAPKLKSNR